MFPNSDYGAYGIVGLYGMDPWGSLNLTESSPPQSFTEPLTVDEVGKFLRMSEDEMGQQADTLAGLISAAREIAEIHQNRDLVRKQWDLSMDYWPVYRHGTYRRAVELRPHLATVDLVKYRDNTGAYTTLTEDTDYVVDAAKTPGLLLPVYGSTWPSYTPWPASSLLIRFTSGLTADSPFWSDAGTRVLVGMKLLISEWFSNRLPLVLGRGDSLNLPDPIVAWLSFGAVPRTRCH